MLWFHRSAKGWGTLAQTCGECLETPVFIVAAVALFGGLALLNYWQPSAVVGWIALVVGLHFFGLARLWKSGSAEINLLALGLTILRVVGIVALVSGVGSGVGLLASSLKGAISLFIRRQPHS